MKPFQSESARGDASLALSFVAFLVLNCISLTTVLHSSTPSDPNFGRAVGLVAAAALFIPLFVGARFSFGYLIGFNFS